MLEPLRRLVADGDRAGCRDVGQMGRDVDGVAERRKLGVAGADTAEADPAGVDPHADSEVGNRPCLCDVARIVPDNLVDPQRGPCRALGIVLVSHGDAEVGADAVALVCLDNAAVLLDRLAHLRHASADELPELVG